MTKKTKSGVVDWYNRQRGYGVIKDDTDKSVYVNVLNLIASEANMVAGRKVTFSTKPRQNHPRDEAFDVQLAPLDSYDEAIDRKSERLKRAAEIRGDEERRWNQWRKVKKEYSEFAEPFKQIADTLSLKEIPLDEAMLRAAFPDDMPPGALPELYDFKDPENRRGAYIGFKKGSITLIVHAFYKGHPSENRLICWRARAFVDAPRNARYMPDKGLKHHIWCEKFEDHFLEDDLPMMLFSLEAE